MEPWSFRPPKPWSRIKIATSFEFGRLLHEATEAAHAGQRQKAIELYDRALNLEIPPADASFAVMERGTTYWEMGEYEKATVDYEDAVRLNPGDPHTFVDRGVARDTMAISTKLLTICRSHWRKSA